MTSEGGNGRGPQRNQKVFLPDSGRAHASHGGTLWHSVGTPKRL